MIFQVTFNMKVQQRVAYKEWHNSETTSNDDLTPN